MSNTNTEFAAKPKARREEVNVDLVNHLKSTTNLYLLNMDYFREAKELYKAPKNDNRFMSVVVAMAKRQEQSGDYGAALASSADTVDKSSQNAAAVNNHVVSLLNEIKENPEIRSMQDVKDLVAQVKAANAMDVIVGGRTENYAVDALDFVVNDVLKSMGKGDAQKGFEALKNGKVSEESVENYGAIAAQKFAVTKEKAAELAAIVDSKAGFAQKSELTQEEAIQKFAEFQQSYRQLPEQLQKSLKELPGPQVLSGVTFKDNLKKDDAGAYTTLIFNKDTREFLPVAFRSEYESSQIVPKNTEEKNTKPEATFNLKEDISGSTIVQNINKSSADLMAIKIDPHGNILKPTFSPPGKN